ncbi:cytochrome c-type biogenesis protein [Salinisphaera sp. SWV1]|uniref:cytochrome c-type biogenesis protein n=1 Tax=Salinisphaera sp. SWV1 TaxID=3454139 RepID=UPI003F83F1E7
MRVVLLFAFLSMGIISAQASAPTEAEHWQTPASWSAQTLARYQHLLGTLRCLVCQDESLAASSAPLAADLRRQIQHKIGQGQTDQQIRQYLVDRYGDFVLYKPPFKPLTWALWVGPFVLLLLGLLVVWIQARRSRRPHPESAGLDARSLALSEQLLSDDQGEDRR